MPRDARILLVDDEADLVDALAEYLALQGMDVRTAATGAQMFAAAQEWPPDVVVLDLHLGHEDGFALAAELLDSAPGGKVPGLLFLSGSADGTDRVIGLELGADDFLSKPVIPRELLARLRALLSRQGQEPAREAVIRLGNVAIDLNRQTVVGPSGGETPLSHSEFALLRCFLNDRGRVWSRDALLDHAPASADFVMDRAIDHRIARLRQKLEQGHGPRPVIEAVRGVGYRLASDI